MCVHFDILVKITIFGLFDPKNRGARSFSTSVNIHKPRSNVAKDLNNNNTAVRTSNLGLQNMFAILQETATAVSAVRDCKFSTFAANLHICSRLPHSTPEKASCCCDREQLNME